MIRFDRVTPDRVQVGDIIMCYYHDDHLERANARVVGIERDETPGTLWAGNPYPYKYRIILTCRHVNLKRPHAAGGPEYRWYHFPWNGVTRYVLPSQPEQGA